MIIIGGATATGKSGIAIEAAKRLNGEIISADSMQIYRKMNVGTAKITIEERENIPHYMIDIIEPTENHSVADFAVEAKRLIKDIEGRKKTPIIVGGTGLYISSLIYEFELGKTDAALRRELYEKHARVGSVEMHEELRRLDPVGAQKIHPNNVKKVIRALEVFMLSGSSLTEKRDKDKKTAPHKMYAVGDEREVLYGRINARVENMFRLGLVEEVEGLIKNEGLNFKMQSMQAIGYREFEAFFDKKCDLSALKEEIAKHTRNYAKRQLTWFHAISTCKFLPREKILDAICSEAV